LDGIINSFFHF
jgi:hypothetical protein